MKQKFLLLCAFAAACSLWSCNKADDFNPEGDMMEEVKPCADDDNLLEGKSLLYKVTSVPHYSAEVVGTNNQIDKDTFSGGIIIPTGIIFDGATYFLNSVGESAFFGYSKMTSVVIGNSVITIGKNAFRYCTSLQSVIIPETVITIGSGAFNRCESLTTVKLPKSVRTIENGAFYDCKSLTTIELQNALTTIGEEAFGFCTSLESVTIPSSVTTISASTFFNCKGLATVTLGEGVKEIKEYAFIGCERLSEVILPNPVPPTLGTGAFDKAVTANCILKVPAESIEAYKSAKRWNEFANIVAI